MAFPTVEEVTLWEDSSAGTSHLVQMPATVNANDLLLVLFMNDGDTAVTTPSGWTCKVTYAYGTYIRVGMYAKIAVGDEDGTTVDFVTAASELCIAQTYRVRQGTWGGSIADDIDGELAVGSSEYPNGPNLTPTWGAKDTLWITAFGCDKERTVSVWPTDYTNTQYNSNEDTSGVSGGSCRRELNAASEDPGAFTLNLGENWIASTLAIEPTQQYEESVTFAAQGGFTLANIGQFGHGLNLGNSLGFNSESIGEFGHGVDFGVEGGYDLGASVEIDKSVIFNAEMDYAVQGGFETSGEVNFGVSLGFSLASYLEKYGELVLGCVMNQQVASQLIAQEAINLGVVTQIVNTSQAIVESAINLAVNAGIAVTGQIEGEEILESISFALEVAAAFGVQGLWAETTKPGEIFSESDESEKTGFTESSKPSGTWKEKKT